MLVEVTYGLWSNSLGLISDAAHMLFDCSALLLGLAASYTARWRPDETFSFGYGRAEVLAGFTNALFLLFIAIYILFEALERLVSPPQLDPVGLIAIVLESGQIVDQCSLATFLSGCTVHCVGDWTAGQLYWDGILLGTTCSSLCRRELPQRPQWLRELAGSVFARKNKNNDLNLVAVCEVRCT